MNIYVYILDYTLLGRDYRLSGRDFTLLGRDYTLSGKDYTLLGRDSFIYFFMYVFLSLYFSGITLVL